jgi:hypothetical protein
MDARCGLSAAIPHANRTLILEVGLQLNSAEQFHNNK